MAYIAVLNAGSSSIKLAAYRAAAEPDLILSARVEGIGTEPRALVFDAAGRAVIERWLGPLDHEAATYALVELAATELADPEIMAVGHRVVHGGATYDAPALVTEELLVDLEKLVPLAPLHQPHNLAPIRAIRARRPGLPQVVCFDTAFHRKQPWEAQAFALPREITGRGVHRYGFHGISYDYIVQRLKSDWQEIAAGRIIVAHLGNGASLCAIHDGISVASTMGFTAVDGLVMGTRCGTLDPGVLIYLMDQFGYDARSLEDLLYRKSGLLGVSGLSSDMRALRASSEPYAAAAVRLFVYRIVREMGSLVAALGGLDGLVFTAGIGANDPATRAEVIDGCSWLGAKIDPVENARGGSAISDPASGIKILVLATDEEAAIARSTLMLVSSASDTLSIRASA